MCENIFERYIQFSPLLEFPEHLVVVVDVESMQNLHSITVPCL